MPTTRNISPDGNTTTNNFELILPVSPFEKWLMTDAASQETSHRDMDDRLGDICIFKPQQMRFLLSIKTVFPKPGGKVWYDDQREVHRQIFDGDETIDYAFMGQDPNAADNRWLRHDVDRCLRLAAQPVPMRKPS